RKRRPPHARSAELDPADTREHLVDLTTGADAGRRCRECEAGDHETECPAENVVPQGERDRGGAEERDADLVREAGRTGVLHRAFTDAWLNELEVREAGEAPPPPD